MMRWRQWCTFDSLTSLNLILWISIIGILSTSCSNDHVTTEGEMTSRTYLLSKADLPAYEEDIDHRALMTGMAAWKKNGAMRSRATTIYRTSCYSCHGTIDNPGSLPDAKKFWQDTFKNGNDPYAMYQTLTRGFGQMPPQLQLMPQQKYEVIAYIREELIKPSNIDQYFQVDDAYLAKLPSGTSQGPEPKPYHPWSDMDYGNWLNRCYEMADEQAVPKKISSGRAPLANEDYSQINFAYKGIAMRLDSGEGGVAKGQTFALFDHDLLRFVGAWSGLGFIDWEDILLDDQHNVYPRTVGTTLFANPITPGWANPSNGSFEDPRIRGSDGRPFGPLPRSWSHYKGLYRYDDRVIISYTVGHTKVLESYTSEHDEIIGRHLTIGPVGATLKLRLLPERFAVSYQGTGVEILQEGGYHVAQIFPGQRRTITFHLSHKAIQEHDALVDNIPPMTSLDQYIIGGSQQYPQTLTSPIISSAESDAYVVDVLTLPFDNPWKSRLRPTGIDFLNHGDDAVICTIDGEVWLVKGIAQKSGNTTWQRIATGLFQPLGIKVHQGIIYVGCRDQIVILRDLNGDGETDFYENFNSDHQVTEHFHEFAMGLQTDSDGNFYYAKSGRHARTSLVPQHGTLIKVSRDGQTSTILANGFRAANGVCLNPDGSFYVTDQQGFWNPMNRINRVTRGGFYGNMWGYGAPEDSSDAAMIQPMCWIDMEYDRSPAELLWADSDRWGPLSGHLLNLSYGYGKIYLVLTQSINGAEQGGMIELPIPQFPTGIMRARMNPKDGQLYVCGMSAWATSRMIQVGGLYRVRYTGADIAMPIKLSATTEGIYLQYNAPLDPKSCTNPDNFEINTWDIRRSSKYGSDRYHEKRLPIDRVELQPDQRSIIINLPQLEPTWMMEIKYRLHTAEHVAFDGAVQNSIYALE